MTAKRFTYDSKTVSILKDEEFWLDGNIDTACNHSEICNELNKLAEENEQLKSKYSEQCIQLDFLKDENRHMRDLVNKNEQLKQLLDYADDLIQSYMSVHNRDEWENVKKNITGDVE